MKMKKVFKSSASYPANARVKPIIFTAVAMVALYGCGSNNLSPHKVVKPETISNVDKNSTEPIEPALAGVIAPVQPVLAPKK